MYFSQLFWSPYSLSRYIYPLLSLLRVLCVGMLLLGGMIYGTRLVLAEWFYSIAEYDKARKYYPYAFVFRTGEALMLGNRCNKEHDVCEEALRVINRTLVIDYTAPDLIMLKILIGKGQ